MTRMATTGNVPTVSSQSVDVVEKYRSLLSADPDLSEPIAAIEALMAVLASSPATTIYESLDLLQNSTIALRQATPNWISLSAGTELFRRYLDTAFRQPGALGPGKDFGILRQQLLSNSKLFISRAKAARAKIAMHGFPFIPLYGTILVHGGSRAVSTMLCYAAEAGQPFQVIQVAPPSDTDKQHSQAMLSKLRSPEIPVAVIPESAVAYALATEVDMVLVGAEGVVENGGIISRLGTYQVAVLAKAASKPVYVASESYKLVRLYPLLQTDLPIKQNIIDFETELVTEQQPVGVISGGEHDPRDYFGNHDTAVLENKRITQGDAVDYTPPDLISALITENGILSPEAVAEEVIKLSF